MKKISGLIILSMFFIVTGCTKVFAEAEYIEPIDYSYYMNLNECSLHVRACCYKINNTIYYPLRAVTDTLGFDIDWDSNNKTISVNKTLSKIFPYEAGEEYEYKHGYKDFYGEIVVEPIYFGAQEMSEGLACVKNARGMDGEYGYININGEEVLPGIYEYATDFHDGLAMVCVEGIASETFPVKFINQQGDVVIDKGLMEGQVSAFCGGYAKFLKEGDLYISQYSSPRKWTFIDKKGNIATNMTFEDISNFNDGYVYYVKNNGKWGVIDTVFNLLMDYQFDSERKARIAFNTFELNVADFKIKTDGEEVALSDDVVVLNDTTYLSTEDIGNVLGVDAYTTGNNLTVLNLTAR